MKKIINYILLSVAALMSNVACTDYLDIPVEAAKTDADVFSDYYNFQGYVDQMYKMLADPMRRAICNDASWGGETIGATNWTNGYAAVRGNYTHFLTRGYYSTSDNNYGPGCWAGWKAIRIANIGLNNLGLFKGTQEEKDLLEGQLLFFRGFSHQEIMAAWGPIPFIDQVLADDFQLPRFHTNGDKTGYQATADRVIADLHRAAELLPVAWDNPTANLGRATALAAKGYEARAALYAGSPLMVQYSGTSLSDLRTPEIDKVYMQKAADAAAEALVMIEENPDSYGLLDWDHYSESFYTNDSSMMPWSKETIWGDYQRGSQKGSGAVNICLGRTHLPESAIFNGVDNKTNNTVTQNYVDLFEMSNGSLYKEEYDGEPVSPSDIVSVDGKDSLTTLKMWDDRDPRFRRAIYVDRDDAGNGTNKALTTLYLYSDDGTGAAGRTRAADQCASPYFIHKFWHKGANNQDKDWNNYRLMCPLMRVAEIYLIYAEAVYNATGDANQKAGECSMSALDAVNAIRSRCGHVLTTATGGYHENFLDQVLYERLAELSFEGFYFHDIRRYRLGLDMAGDDVCSIDFNRRWTSFKRVPYITYTFEEKNHWIPFPSNMCKMYAEFPQNPGWE